MKKPILLCILDGWGFGDESDPNNAIARADLKNYPRILQTYPFSKLETSGLAVGLPEGQIGNSEVGHMTIGAGRVIFQDLPRINNAITNGEILQNQDLQKMIFDLKKLGKSLHLMGLLSDGGVHSHQDHIIFLANYAAQNGVKTFMHFFLDGRDVAQKSAKIYLDNFFNKTKNPNINLATISGRYYAMDRDKKWDRINLAYDAIVNAKTKQEKKYSNKNYQELIDDSYEKNITDEFVKPCAFEEYQGFADGDAFLFCNFRADRARQISTAILDEEFREFVTKKINFSHKIALTEYSEKLNKFYKILFPSNVIKNSLPEILENKGLKQLRIAETEKYAHVTFFFSCGKEQEFQGEKRILIQSPKVATYDLQPEMSASEITQNLVRVISEDQFDFIVVNYANPDMVGHSGDLAASIKACRAIDEQLKILEKLILQKNGLMLISADHGNIECMRDENNEPHTAHTTNLVPLILVGNNISHLSLDDGNLSDIAPTILQLMNIDQPLEMTGQSLIKISANV